MRFAKFGRLSGAGFSRSADAVRSIRAPFGGTFSTPEGTIRNVRVGSSRFHILFSRSVHSARPGGWGICVVGRLVGRMVGGLVNLLVGNLVGWLAGWLVGWLVSWLVGWLASRLLD